MPDFECFYCQAVPIISGSASINKKILKQVQDDGLVYLKAGIPVTSAPVISK
jgi:hypothetical protein